MIKRIRILFFILLITLLFFSCSAKMVNTQLVTSANMHSGSALVVYILQLSDDSKLESISREDFWRNPDKISDLLSEHLLEKIARTLHPKEIVTLEIKPLKETKYIAFVGNFLEPDPNSWYQIVSIEDLKQKNIVIGFLENSITVVEKKD